MKNKVTYLLLIGFIICCQSVFSQGGNQNMIRGKLFSDTNEELIAASVLEIDKNNRIISSVLTNMDGEFSLLIKNPQNKLKVSYVGFKTQVLNIGTRREFNIMLVEDNMLEEVVVKGKQMITDGTLNIPINEVSYAMQKINTQEFEGIQVASIDDALQGRIAGLDIVGSGDVGRAGSMRIRGTSSINANTEPLIVMNGIPKEVVLTPNFDFATANEEQFAELLNINPDDIESIVVLKDAASTAVWGSRGSNGVLMINTKKGATGPTRVTYTYRLTGREQPPGMKMLRGDDYTMLMKQAYFNPSQSNAASDIREFNYISKDIWPDAVNYSVNTNWRDEVIQTGWTNDHYLVVTGGGEKAKFRLTGGYYNQTGTVIGQSLDRFTSRMDLDYQVSSRIRFVSEFAFTYSDNERNWSDGRDDNNKLSLLDIAYRKMPNLSVYDLNNPGTYYTIPQTSGLHDSQKFLRNPVALGHLATNNLKAYNIQPTLRLQYDLIEPDRQMLRYNVWVSFAVKNEKTSKFLPKELSSMAWDNESINRADDYDYNYFGIQTENSLTWQPRLPNPDHSVLFFGSVQTSTGNNSNHSVVSYGLPDPTMSDASANGYLLSVGSGLERWRSIGFIGRMHYAYKSKYIFDLTVRRDGSTKFGRDNKFGTFPGVSLRWNLSDESFMDFSNGWLDMLSIRPSWGISGNQPKWEYMHFSKYGPYSSYAGTTTIRPNNIRLSNLKWEKTTGTNMGMDIAVLDYKYTMDVNFYRRNTEDILFENPAIPSSSGFSSLPYRNGGSMNNDGWELNFRANKFVKVGNVTFDLHFNLANSVNTLKSLDQDILNSYNRAFSYENGKYLTRIQENNAYGSVYGFRYKGVYQYSAENYTKGTAPVARNAQGEVIYDNKGIPLPMYFNYGVSGVNYRFQAGDAIYEDINNDGNIDELDIVYLGNSNPKLNGGFGTTLRWKQLSCNLFFNFRYGNKIVNKARMNAENMFYNNNQSVAVNWRWRKEGDVTEMPRALYNYGYNWLASDRYVEDGSFLRFKYLTFNYAVPSTAIHKYGLKQLNFYLTFNNLFCITKYSGVDPEVGYGSLGVSEDNSTTPRSKDFTLGITIGF